MEDIAQWGFSTMTEDAAADPLLHLYPWKNEFSPFGGVDRLRLGPKATDRLFVDTYYGLCYDPWDDIPDALYGRTADLPEYAGESLANMGFLRVPFRRIPRRLVRNRAELEAIVNSITSADDNLTLLLRGQAKEHLIPRPPQARQVLYGDPKAIEPSLISSAVRRGKALEDHFPEWCALLQLFLRQQIGNVAKWASISTLQQMENARLKLTSTHHFALFALAMAQHYGLPSLGLDATTKIDVALFFALRKFECHPNEKHIHLCRQDFRRSEPSVIYLLSPTKPGQLEYESFRPTSFAASRPDQQAAHFIHTGWGMRKNAGALQLFLALYLDPDGDFGELPTVGYLFPYMDDDPFGRFLEETTRNVGTQNIQELLQDFGWVVQG
jgi:hypothetical protein